MIFNIMPIFYMNNGIFQEPLSIIGKILLYMISRYRYIIRVNIHNRNSKSCYHEAYHNQIITNIPVYLFQQWRNFSLCFGT